MKYALGLALVLIGYTSFGQSNRLIDSILVNNIIKVPAYQLSKVGNETLVLKMNYAASSFIDTTGIYQLQNAQILSVDLVFTDYPTTQNLLPLNKTRLQSLAQLLPTATQQPHTNWQIIREING
ncbi:MAG: hypothetical protein H7101_05875, partial [Deinococcales bacterium]|nr:hypothetical protein [Chitinophagaceae bacterium]